jgi:trans-aconitate 2-methyltransferase
VSGRYTFGDSDLAAARLGLVAEVFETPSRALLARAIPRGCDAVLDLGCGPGYTTRLIAEVCRPRRAVGLELSERFVDIARGLTVSRDPSLTYETADVTSMPLPHSPVDAIHARLLLAHLPDPLGMVEQWRTQLTPGGVLVLDEVEDIDAPPGVLSEYESLVVAVVAAGGGAMYAGRVLEPLSGTTVDVHVPQTTAARMFAMNLAGWRVEAEAQGLADKAELDRLAGALATLAEGGETRTVRWVLRQLVLGA